MIMVVFFFIWQSKLEAGKVSKKGTSIDSFMRFLSRAGSLVGRVRSVKQIAV